MRNKRSFCLNQIVQLTQAIPVPLNCKARHPPDDLAQQIHHRGNIEDLNAKLCSVKVDDVQSCSACGGSLDLRIAALPSLRLRPQEELNQLERAGRADMLREICTSGQEDARNFIPPNSGGMTACHQVECFIGKR